MQGDPLGIERCDGSGRASNGSDAQDSLSCPGTAAARPGTARRNHTARRQYRGMLVDRKTANFSVQNGPVWDPLLLRSQ